jgi:glycosyltransferase involved in cell wall biosynthesis
MYRALIIKGTSQYDVLQKFSDELHQGFMQLGIHSTLIDTEQPQWDSLFFDQLKSGCNFVAALNGVAADFKLHGESIYNLADIPYVGIYVDHPYAHVYRLSQDIKRYIVTMVDKSDIDFLKRYFPNHFKLTGFLPHAGVNGNHLKLDKAYFSRSNNLLFTGTFTNLPQKPWHALPNEFVKNLIEDVYCAKNPTRTTLETFEYILAEKGLYFNDAKLQRDIALCILEMIDDYDRNANRRKTIDILLKNGYTLDVYGNGDWNALSHKNLNYKGISHFHEILKLYTQYKLTLNDLCIFHHGSHERVFNALASGCCCVTTVNPYYNNTFQDRIDMAMFSPGDEESLLSAVEYALIDENAYAMVQSGRRKVLRDHLWVNRAKTIIGLYELSTIEAGY